MPEIVYRFVGNAAAGEGLMGIPGRDLTDEDLAALPPGTEGLLDASRIFEKATAAAAPGPATEPAPEPAPAPPASRKAAKPAE